MTWYFLPGLFLPQSGVKFFSQLANEFPKGARHLPPVLP
jgi:hypothetical protein